MFYLIEMYTYYKPPRFSAALQGSKGKVIWKKNLLSTHDDKIEAMKALNLYEEVNFGYTSKTYKLIEGLDNLLKEI